MRDDQTKLIDILERLTLAGKAIWLKRRVEPEFVSCYVGGELIIFEQRFAIDRGIQAPGEPLPLPDGVVVKARNHSFLWLPDLYGWDKVIWLMGHAEFVNAHAVGLTRQCIDKLISDLEGIE